MLNNNFQKESYFNVIKWRFIEYFIGSEKFQGKVFNN